jgi:hypothetical protein
MGKKKGANKDKGKAKSAGDEDTADTEDWESILEAIKINEAEIAALPPAPLPPVSKEVEVKINYLAAAVEIYLKVHDGHYPSHDGTDNHFTLSDDRYIGLMQRFDNEEKKCKHFFRPSHGAQFEPRRNGPHLRC